MDILLRAVLLAPYGLLLVSLGINAWRLYVIYRDSPHRQPRDVSNEHRPMPARLTAWAAELKQLGFQRLGEIELALPAIGLVRGVTRRTERHTAWMFIDPQRATEAAVVERLVEFSSRHTDGSFVETMYPIGERINEPDLVINRVKSSISDAYERHRTVVDARVAEHGALRPILTMADQQVHDAEFRVRHAQRQLRAPLVFRGLLPLAATAIFIAVLGWTAFSAIDTIARVLTR